MCGGRYGARPLSSGRGRKARRGCGQGNAGIPAAEINNYEEKKAVSGAPAVFSIHASQLCRHDCVQPAAHPDFYNYQPDRLERAGCTGLENPLRSFYRN